MLEWYDRHKTSGSNEELGNPTEPSLQRNMAGVGGATATERKK